MGILGAVSTINGDVSMTRGGAAMTFTVVASPTNGAGSMTREGASMTSGGGIGRKGRDNQTPGATRPSLSPLGTYMWRNSRRRKVPQARRIRGSTTFQRREENTLPD